jgi:multidrug efflux pump
MSAATGEEGISAAPDAADQPSPSRLFILRPIATTLLMLAVLLAGFVGTAVAPKAIGVPYSKER